jgi:predicted RNA-binding protein YlxR (DUF448 family)
MAKAMTTRAGAHKAARGARAGHAQSLRRCLVSGEIRPKEELIRFVLGPDGDVVPDLAERLPGRGLWLKARRDIVDAACAKQLFAKAARRPARVPADLGPRVEALLVRRCLDTLGLARRSGQVAVGSEKARAALKAGKAAVLVAAAEAAGLARMRALAPNLPLVDLFSGTELGVALGREHLAYVVVFPGRLAQGLLREAARLAGFRAAAGPRSPGGLKRRARVSQRSKENGKSGVYVE